MMPFIKEDKISAYFHAIDQGKLSIANAISVLTQEFNEDVAHESIRNYCMYTTHQANQRVCLEFLYTNNYFRDLQALVTKCKHSSNELNQQWADVFQLLIDRRFDYFQTEKYHQRLNDIKTTNPALICLIELTRLGLHYDQGHYNQMPAFDDIHYYYFGMIQDDYLLDCFYLKLYHYLFIYYWTRNELILARKYAYRALNQTRNAYNKASLHMNLGLTYLYDTYEKGMYHLHQSIEIAEREEYVDIYETVNDIYIPFLSAHFRRVHGVTSKDKGEQAHIEIAKGNKGKAIELLQSEPLNTPYKLYYYGLATQDEELLQEAYQIFTQERHLHFFARLPLQALRELEK